MLIGGCADQAAVTDPARCREDPDPVPLLRSRPEPIGAYGAHVAALADLGDTTAVLVHHWAWGFGPVGANEFGPEWALELPDQLSVAIVDSELALVTEPRAMPRGDDGPSKPLPVALHPVPAGVMAVWVEYPASVIDGHAVLGRVGTAYTRLVTIEDDDRSPVRLPWGAASLDGRAVAGYPTSTIRDGDDLLWPTRLMVDPSDPGASWAYGRIGGDGTLVADPELALDGGAGTFERQAQLVGGGGELWFVGLGADSVGDGTSLRIFMRPVLPGAAPIALVEAPIDRRLRLHAAAEDGDHIIIVWSVDRTLHATVVDHAGSPVREHALATAMGDDAVFDFFDVYAHPASRGAVHVSWTEPRAESAERTLMVARIDADRDAAITEVAAVDPSGIGEMFPIPVLLVGDQGLVAWHRPDGLTYAQRFCVP
jgi:hypothetical protein